MDEYNTAASSADNSGNLAQNEYVQELFSILQDNGKDSSGLAALIGHVSEMESFVKRAEDKIADMKSQLAEMKEIQNHPVKTAFQNAIKALETKVAEVKERIAELKAGIIDGCKSAVEAFKEKGASVLNNLAKFFHVKNTLKGIDKSAAQGIKQCDKAISDINGFAAQYHEAGRAIKNMGLILIGREPVDQKKENGKLAKAMCAPNKAYKTALTGIRNAVDKAIAALDGMEERQAARKQERVKKPSILVGLEENKVLAAEHNRAVAQREKTVVKGAEI
jgi:hypothetical protein